VEHDEIAARTTELELAVENEDGAAKLKSGDNKTKTMTTVGNSDEVDWPTIAYNSPSRVDEFGVNEATSNH